VNLAQGQRCERQALAFLQHRGLVSLASNYRCRGGELDLVMQDAGTLVVVEVRSRSRGALCSAEDSITRTKQQRIIHATRHYLAMHPNLADRPVRFDVVAISLGDGENEARWIRDAFRA
jgi:putative endonuclease